MIRLLLIVLGAAVATDCGASTSAAWTRGNAEARAACLKVAGLAQATASPPVLFSDEQGKTAILVTGRYRQQHMKGARGQALCLYDRRTKHAEASEAKGWSVR